MLGDYGKPQEEPKYYKIYGICVSPDTGLLRFLELKGEQRRLRQNTPLAPGEEECLWQLEALKNALQMTAEQESALCNLSQGEVMDHPFEPGQKIRRESDNLFFIIRKK